jgi:HEAT repeat protein
MSEWEPLIARLRNLHDGPLVVHEVVRLGDEVIPSLERLLRAAPDAVYHPRCLAADALAAIGTLAAITALIRGLLDSSGRDLPPILLEAESVLVNNIADHLGGFPGREVADALLVALERRRYPYCASALGRLREARAIPLLIECLYEDTARLAAMGALRRFGEAARQPLVRALRQAPQRGVLEPPGRTDGRAASAGLLGELAGARAGDDRIVICALSGALHDPQRPVRVEAALWLVRCGAPAWPEAVRVLSAALPEENWARAREIIETLAGAGFERGGRCLYAGGRARPSR